MTKEMWFAFTLACLAFLVRTQGILLILAMLGWLAWHRGWKACGVLAGMAAATQAGVWLLMGASRYGRQFMMRDPYNASMGTAGIADIGERVVANLTAYTRILAETLIPAVSYVPWLAYVAGIVLIVLVVRGWRCR